jgi:3-mercaptopyruvate sulfurtransferase SseA
VLLNHGFRHVRPLHGGLDAWIAAGYAVEDVLPAGAVVTTSAAAATPPPSDTPRAAGGGVNPA